MAEPRLALLYSDGSVGILPADADLAQAERDADFADLDDDDEAHRTRIARVTFAVMEILPRVLPIATTCSTCGRTHDALPEIRR